MSQTEVESRFNSITGPTSLYYFRGAVGLQPVRSFFFFGEYHGKLVHSYNGELCTRFGSKLQVKNPESKCHDVTYVLQQTFEQTADLKRYVDFFIEFPFQYIDNQAGYIKKFNNLSVIIRDPIYKLSADDKEFLEDLEYLGYFYVLFYPSLTRDKIGCQYSPYVRFHYTDIRSRKDQIITLSQNLYFYYYIPLTDLIHKIFLLARTKFAESHSQRQEMIDIIKDYGNFLAQVSVIYDKLNQEILRVYLYSDNFSVDMEKLLMRIIDTTSESRAKNKFLRLLPDSLTVTVNRHGRIVSKVRAQLLALREENHRIPVNSRDDPSDDHREENIIHTDKNLADLIEDFILTESRSCDLTNFADYMQILVKQIIEPLTTVETEAEYFDLWLSTQQIRVCYNLQEAIGRFILPDSLLVDAYTLARMFRTFPGTGHVISSEVYTYHGDVHAGHYSKFFTDYLHMPLLNKFSSDSSIKCLDLEE